MHIERKSYTSYFFAADHSPEELLRHSKATNIYNRAKPIILSVDPTDPRTEPTAEEARGLHVLGLHLLDQVKKASMGVISAVETTGSNELNEFVVMPVVVVRKNAEGGWKVGYFDKIENGLRPYQTLDYIKDLRPYAEHPNLQSVVTSICGAFNIADPSIPVDTVALDSKLEPFPGWNALVKTLITAAKTDASQEIQIDSRLRGTFLRTHSEKRNTRGARLRGRFSNLGTDHA